MEFQTENLPLNHPDVAFSLLQYSLAAFELGQLSDANWCLGTMPLSCIQKKQSMTSRKKIINNLNVGYYQLQDLVNTLNYLMSAL